MSKREEIVQWTEIGMLELSGMYIVFMSILQRYQIVLIEQYTNTNIIFQIVANFRYFKRKRKKTIYEK